MEGNIGAPGLTGPRVRLLLASANRNQIRSKYGRPHDLTNGTEHITSRLEQLLLKVQQKLTEHHLLPQCHRSFFVQNRDSKACQDTRGPQGTEAPWDQWDPR